MRWGCFLGVLHLPLNCHVLAMTRPALMFELEDPVEERLASVEATIEHMRSDISDIKIDIRRLDDKIDALDEKLTAKIDGANQKSADKFDSIMQALADLKIAHVMDRVWFLLMAATLLGIMARGFKWI